MIVKKFQGRTEEEALLAAKAELGSNAVVLNVKELKQRGIFRLFKKDKVEITAALEEQEFVKGEIKKPVFDKQVSDTTEVAEPTEIEKKLDSLHMLLQNQMDKERTAAKELSKTLEDNSEVSSSSVHYGENGNLTDNGENSNFKFLQLIYNKLIDNEVDEKYANGIIGDIESSIKKESNIDSLLAGVYQKIILKLGKPETIKLEDKPKIVFFIGPTGVGKTTTLAKLASKFNLEEHKKVAFITADTYRIAAVEQLNKYAAILGIPVSVIYDASELEGALNEYTNFDLIMIDTAGRSHKEDDKMLEIVDLVNRTNELSDKFDVEVYLTLSITTKYKDLVRITESYSEIKDYRILFTKLDETCSLGNILNVKLLTGASLSYTTSGQNVPDDIEVINEQALAKLLLGGNE